ncbi:UPF0719 transmembrane protein YshE [Paenibacillus sp. J31TS4]|uniref:DUF350 domain-containing protein n=1 Tax=Paenibacillus sp. J31TS4 TaxID=2807195 RepID=UPI001B14C422|nr:DUF350 domain-containing protein [Paenibacillus sp. J31TS4]GIP38797.1 UPF0719 transmembrane protein YshE [Paenibacillus sp. J31TS4]
MSNEQQLDRLMANPYFETLTFFTVAILALIVFMTIFNFVTHYNDWDEIKKGNVSVAMATGGKIFGICNIFRFAILNNDTLLESIVWSSYGFVLLLAAYYIFELLTPYFKIEVEIKKDNRAVGLVSFLISVSISYVIGASVT